MRVLLDENLPHDLAGALIGNFVSTVQGLGWAGTKNGALLKRASDVCDVFITMDGNIEHQQNLADLSFGAVVIDAPSNRMADLLPVVPDLLQAIDAVRPGEVRHVGKSPKRRGESGQRSSRSAARMRALPHLLLRARPSHSTSRGNASILTIGGLDPACHVPGSVRVPAWRVRPRQQFARPPLERLSAELHLD